MSTGTDHDEEGQMALMDAMVFFAIVLLICSIQMSALSQDVRSDDPFVGVSGRSDPSCILPVLMRASIGTESSIQVGGGLSVPADTMISKSLAAEAAALVNGIAEDAFCDLNRLIICVVTNLTHPLTNPHLILNRHSEDGTTVLLRLEHSLPTSRDVIAASCDLPDCGNDRITVSLLLEPALFLESRNV